VPGCPFSRVTYEFKSFWIIRFSEIEFERQHGGITEDGCRKKVIVTFVEFLQTDNYDVVLNGYPNL
jgi:hypothetical protein